MIRALTISKFGIVQLRQVYQKVIQENSMHHDEKQIRVIQQLQRLNDQLIEKHVGWQRFAQTLNENPPTSYRDMSTTEQKNERRKNFFQLFSREFSTYSSGNIRIKGMYLFGGSGCGKSFLSDLFYDHLDIKEKTKVHFHEFMANIHSQLFKLEKEKKGFDPLNVVAARTAKKTRLLYLDEFQVTDVADASILKRFFQQLLNNELVLLATSNRKPSDLYKNGHQREFFLPFIDFLEQRCEIKDIDSHKDYRYDLEKDNSDLTMSYLSPVDEVSEEKIQKIFSLLTGESNPKEKQVKLEPVPGRILKVPRACNQVCLYYFQELMENVMGDSDFRAICKNFKAIIIKNMRQIKRQERNTANRLIKLFDEAYYRNVKIYIEGTVGLDELIMPIPEKQATVEEDFALARCKSRLMEFQTKKYKQQLSYAEKPTEQ